jgi:secreted trypsin-like serine protease
MFYSSLESTLNVFAGIHNLTFEYIGSTPPLPGIRFNVSKTIIHPNFDENTFENDIALLILKENVTKNEFINYACLPKEKSNEFPSVNESSWIVGWGHLNEYEDEPEELQNVKVKILPNEYCSRVAKDTPKFWHSQLCSGNYSGGQDACQGDSGGGLYTRLASRYILSGIVSYGDGCARPKLPGIYTRLSYYLDWIEDEMNKLNPRTNEQQPNVFQELMLNIKNIINKIRNFFKNLF